MEKRIKSQKADVNAKINQINQEIEEANFFLHNETFNDMMERQEVHEIDEELMREIMHVPKINIQL